MSRHATEARFWDEVYGDLDPTSSTAPSDIDAVHSVYSDHGGCLESERFFASLLQDLRERDVVCVGGGVDRLALALAAAGNNVLSIDLSQVAVQHTNRLAQQRGLATHLSSRQMAWEDASFQGDFDIAVVHHAWHHMHFDTALHNFHACLRPGGMLVAMEPVCRLAAVRRVHQRLPYHPMPFIAGERELDDDNLAAVRRTFGRTSLRFFDALSRESISWNLYRAGFPGVLRGLSRVDAWALRNISPLRQLATYVVVQAWIG